jgi:hypothetical protein
MGYNKIPLALKFNDDTGNAEGLIEFQLNLSDVGDVCSSTPSQGQGLVWSGGSDGSWCPSTLPAGGGGGTPTLPGGNNGDLLINTGGGTTYLASAASDAGIMQLDPYFDANDEGAVAQWDGTKLEVTFPDQLYMLVEAGESIAKGDVVYVTGDAGNGRFIVAKANASDSTKMPAVGLAPAAITVGTNGKIVSFGRAIGLNTAGMTVGRPVYVATTAGGITKDKPTGATDLIQNIGIVSVVDGTNGVIKVTGVGRANDIPINVDVVGSATIGTNEFTQTSAKISNVDQNSVMITDGASVVSSVSGASGSIVYFENDPPRPGLKTFSSILSNENYNIEPGKTYVTDDGLVSVTGPLTINSTLAVTGTLDVTGDATFASATVTATPTAANDVANKSYVDSQIPTPSYFQALASGTLTLDVDATEYNLGWSTSGTYAITDPAGNLEVEGGDSQGNNINVSGDGVYQIDCSVQATNTTNGGRVGATIRIYRDIGDGDGFTEISELRAANYSSRGIENILTGTTHLNTLISLNDGDKLKFTIMRNTYTGTPNVTSDGTYLRIIKIA